jgi:hypothetical protein
MNETATRDTGDRAMMTATEVMTDAEKLAMIRLLAEGVLELTEDKNTRVKEFWLLRDQMKYILRVIEDQL